jgi:3-hydroxyisobutyrate dehydrogenase
MTTENTALGYIGLGLMGLPMTLRLVRAGYGVSVWNRTREKLKPALEEGAVEAPSPAAVARDSDIVFTCVYDTAALEEVVFGAGGIAEGGTAEKILIDLSSVKPDATRDMAMRLKDQSGMRWIDAPVTGGQGGAQEGTLVLMAGGEAADIEAVRPVVAHLSRRFAHMGPQGAGQVTKLCNQLVSCCQYLVLAEMVALARDGGVDVDRLPGVLEGGVADSTMMQNKVPRMLARDFVPQGKAANIIKDLDNIGEFARANDTPIPVAALAAELWRFHIAKGNSDLDSVSIIKMFDR